MCPLSMDAHGISYLTDEDIYDNPRTDRTPHLLISHKAYAHYLSQSYTSITSFLSFVKNFYDMKGAVVNPCYPNCCFIARLLCKKVCFDKRKLEFAYHGLDFPCDWCDLLNSNFYSSIKSLKFV